LFNLGFIVEAKLKKQNKHKMPTIYNQKKAKIIKSQINIKTKRLIKKQNKTKFKNTHKRRSNVY